MKTIASTKVSGCSTTNKGWALFMHEWSTTNRQLRLSWTDSVSGCNEIYSESTLVPYDKWVMVGFSLSKARNRASIMLDKQLIVDTQLGLGKTMGIQQAGIDQRILSDSGKILFGAHIMPKATDIAMAHGFIGFMGDTRILAQSTDGAKLVNLLHCEAKEISQAQHVLVQHQVKSESINSISGGRLQPRYVKGFNAGEGQSAVPIVKWDAKPAHPMSNDAAAAALEIESVPGPTLPPEKLSATWPKEWLSRYGKEELMKSQTEADVWAAEVRGAMKHTWDGYRTKAWGHDEVQPNSGRPKDRDAKLAAGWKERPVGISPFVGGLVPDGGHNVRCAVHAVGDGLFEINIRAFAGLLSAYSLSGKRVFLDTARRLGEKLLSAFTSPSGLPLPTIDIGTGKAAMHSWNANTVLAEATTLQVEFRYMSKVTGDSRWQEAADKAMDVVLKAAGQRGLIPHESNTFKIAFAVLTAILKICTLIYVGVRLEKSEMLNGPKRKCLSALAMEICLPCLLFSAVLPEANAQLLEEGWELLMWPLIYSAVSGLLGILCCLAVGIPKQHLGAAAACAGFPNVNGFPVSVVSALGQAIPNSASGFSAIVFLSIIQLTDGCLKYTLGPAIFRRDRRARRVGSGHDMPLGDSLHSIQGEDEPCPHPIDNDDQTDWGLTHDQVCSVEPDWSRFDAYHVQILPPQVTAVLLAMAIGLGPSWMKGLFIAPEDGQAPLAFVYGVAQDQRSTCELGHVSPCPGPECRNLAMALCPCR
eukprot:g14109.t1